MKIWPNFFIVGASKSGTSSLYEYLRQSPDVFMSPIKEPRFFNSSQYGNWAGKIERISDKTKYLKLFEKANTEKAIGEASPSYLQDPNSAELIHQQIHDAKIIIILRDPTQRAFSHYLMDKSEGREKRSFYKLVSNELKKKYGHIDQHHVIELGLYVEKVKRFLAFFGKNNVKILFFEEFVKDTKKSVEQVLDFLQVNPVLPPNIEKIYNAYGIPRGKMGQYILNSKTLAKLSNKFLSRTLKVKLKDKFLLKKVPKPKIPKSAQKLLQEFYRQDAKQLEQLIGRKLPWPWL